MEDAVRHMDIVVSGILRQTSFSVNLTSQQGTQWIIVALGVSQHTELVLVPKLYLWIPTCVVSRMTTPVA